MDENKKYQIVEFMPKTSSPKPQENVWDYDFEVQQTRFAIADESGKIIDDAQGYGYKTRQKAYLASNWKFKGGKQKQAQQKNDYKKWIKSNPVHQQILKRFNNYLEWNFKELARKEINIDEIWQSLEKQYNLQIPGFVKKQTLK